MADIPWTYSETLQRHYVYLPTRDELLFQNGQRIRRPSALAVEDLEDATYDGSISQFSQSPPSAHAQYIHSASRPVATARHETHSQQGSSRDTGREPRSYQAPDDLATRLARARLNAFPEGMLTRNPANRDELEARVVVDRTSSDSANPSVGATINKADVYGIPTERLYPEYKMRKKDFFFVGKIFSILWSEPLGGTRASTVITSREEAIVPGPYGEKIFSKIRRFVVIRSGDGYCNALPISTYNGQGVGKQHVVKHEHAVIYTNPLPSALPRERPTRDEKPMCPLPIRVDPDTRAEKLDPASRVNFGHPHTIQYNVKVKSCGKVGDDSLTPLLTQFHSVFSPASQSQASRVRAESSRAPVAASSSSNRPASGRSAGDTIQAALIQLMAGMTREEAVAKMIEVLQDKGLGEDEAKALIRRALS